jgi:Family of unknown function (DUF5906)
VPVASTPHDQRAAKGAAAKARAKARKNNNTPNEPTKNERPMTDRKSHIVTDEEFKARFAAYNRENPQQREPEVVLARRAKKEAAKKINSKAPGSESTEKKLPDGVTLDDFSAFMPMHSYIYHPTGEMWPAASVNSRIEPVPLVDEDGQPVLDDKGRQQVISASGWLDRNSAVEQMTWAPGEPRLIKGRLVSNGGWVKREGVTCFNLYRPPSIKHNNAAMARPWVKHAYRIYGKSAKHIIKYMAFKVQRPQDKINHALLLGGGQGIGKDTLCEPLKYAVGPWNFEEVSPKQVGGRFNGFVKSVFLRINELRDLGDGNRFDFYEHMKVFTASPPDVLRVDEKHIREYPVFNVCGVIVTTNYKTNGIYLPAEDRRHYVAWSNLKKENFSDAYWDKIWKWYESGGFGHVAAYLATLDISDFNPKAAPPKTEAFWAIVDANRSPEDSELADAIDRLGQETTGEDGQKEVVRPKAITIDKIALVANGEFALWLRDPKSRRAIPHRLEECGYTPVRNPHAKDGLWKIRDRRQAVYAQSGITPRDQLDQANALAGTGIADHGGTQSVQSVKSVVRHYPPGEKAAKSSSTVADSARPLTTLTTLTGNGYAISSNPEDRHEPEPGQIFARVTIREIRPPALGPAGDDLNDFTM